MSERTCLRCGAPYDEGATVCFTCGASIGELETPTQPVKTPKGHVAASGGAASDTPHSDASGATEAPPTTPAPASSPAPKRVMVGSSLPVAAPPTAAPKPRRRLRVIGATLIVVIVLLAGGGYALRAALAGPPVPKTVTYRDPNGRFSLIVPALWTATRQANGALLTDSSGANTVTISVSPPKPGQTATSVADALAGQQGLRPAAPTQIGGDTWEQRSGQVTGQDGATRAIVVYVDVRDGEVYTIQLSSPTASYTTVNNLVYQPLLASFSFT
jgi:hypothetical protein